MSKAVQGQKITLAQAEPVEKLPVPLFLAGLVASCFVGFLYGYNALKDDIVEYWKHDLHVPQSEIAYVDNGQVFGFCGQYLAIVPGLIFDSFGASITCIYGGVFCLLGFGMIGYAAKTPCGWMVALGAAMAGQGSKALGFGSLLGVTKNIPKKYAPLVSGMFLGADALSAVFALMGKMQLQSVKGITGDSSNEDKADFAQTFFWILGGAVAVVAICVATYFHFYFKAKAEEEAAEEVEFDDSPVAPPVVTGRKSLSSLVDEAASVADGYGSEDEDIEAQKTAHATSGRTFWVGVVCAYIFMFLGESQGLTFQGNFQDTFTAGRNHNIGGLTAYMLTHDKSLVKGQMHLTSSYYPHQPTLKTGTNAKDEKTFIIDDSDSPIVIPADFDDTLMTKGGEKLTMNDCTGAFKCDFVARYVDGWKLAKGFKKILAKYTPKDHNGDTYVHNAAEIPYVQFVNNWEAKEKDGVVTLHATYYNGQKVSVEVTAKEVHDVQIYNKKHMVSLDDEGKQSYKHNNDSAKFWFVVVFALCNAIGRLGMGALSEPLSNKFPSLFPNSSWFVMASIGFFALFFYVWSVGGIRTTEFCEGTDDKVCKPGLPFSPFFLLAFDGIVYGAVFTGCTEYLRKVTAEAEQGKVIGMSLVVLAAGQMILKTLLFPQFIHDPVGDKVSDKYMTDFVKLQMVCMIPAFFAALFMWHKQRKTD